MTQKYRQFILEINAISLVQFAQVPLEINVPNVMAQSIFYRKLHVNFIYFKKMLKKNIQLGYEV